MLSLRSTQESSLFFPVIISYCQLRLVLAAHSLLIVNSVDPHSELQGKTRADAMTESLFVMPEFKRQVFLFLNIAMYNST